MDEEKARAVLAKIDSLRKRKGHGWEYSHFEISKHGEACVNCSFNVSTVTLQKWFKGAGARVFWFERLVGKKRWNVWFEFQPVLPESF